MYRKRLNFLRCPQDQVDLNQNFSRSLLSYKVKATVQNFKTYPGVAKSWLASCCIGVANATPWLWAFANSKCALCGDLY